MASKQMKWCTVVFVAFGWCTLLTPVAWGTEDPMLLKSRVLADAYATQLKSALIGALASGGPANAVSVCKDLAPKIASELSRSSGAKVTRTSLKYRNPSNAPEPWQRRVLEDFDLQLGRSNANQPLEYFLLGAGTQPTHYARAISTDAVCLVCHGRAVQDNVLEILDLEYPFDRAHGYVLGELRGAFSVSWPDDGSSN